jgi:DNA-binding beta-propeller fold protein YncE
MQISADGNRLLVTDHTDAMIFDLDTGALVSTIRHPGEEMAYEDMRYVSLSPDGKSLWTNSRLGEAYIWDVDTGSLRHNIDSELGENEVSGGSFSPDGKIIVTGSSQLDQAIKVWNAETGSMIREIGSHEGWVPGIIFSPDGSRFASWGEDGKVVLWDTASGQFLAEFFAARYMPEEVRFSPDGTFLSVVTSSGELQIYDALGNISAMETRDLRAEGCKKLKRQGVAEFDPGFPILQDMGAGGTALTNPCDRRGLLSPQWWGSTLRGWWQSVLPAKAGEEETDRDNAPGAEE